MPEKIQRKDEAPPLHKQGKIPVWEEIPLPDVGETIKKNKKIVERKPSKEPSTPYGGCGCW